jgi:hypothetical protein
MGQGGHFCPNVFPLAKSSGPYQGVLLKTGNPRLSPLADGALREKKTLTGVFAGPIVTAGRVSEGTAVHTVRTLQIIM